MNFLSVYGNNMGGRLFMKMGAIAPPNPPNAGSVIIYGIGMKPFFSIMKSLKSNLPSKKSLKEICYFGCCALAYTAIKCSTKNKLSS